MAVAKILRLEKYRDRRHHRLKLAGAFAQIDPCRQDILGHLASIADACGADRVAAVWVDEYGPGLIHPYLVLDLFADRPRRSFPIEPLKRAWEIGVPGAHDAAAGRGATGPSTCAIALGSDGARAWFVVADSVSARPPLDDRTRDRLMFLAGECSAVVLHRDLDAAGEGADGESRFAGWPILKDLEGREEDEPESRRIAKRFVVARLPRMLLDHDLVMSDERVRELVRSARSELHPDTGLDPKERNLWNDVLEALEAREDEVLAELLHELGVAAEERGHAHGARELYACAFGIATAIGSAASAADAARRLGRMYRRSAAHESAGAWYETARAISSAAGIQHLNAMALSGLGSLMRDRGNLPGAREVLTEALDLARASGHHETIVTAHLEIVSLEHSAGNLREALHHGWLAVGASGCEQERTRCMASLAGALERAGDYDLAVDAWTVVAETSDELYLRVFALDALGHICAVRGDRQGFERFSSQCDALDYDHLLSARSQILYYRGLSYRALGSLEEARAWLGRAVAFAEENGFSEILFKAEADLDALSSHVPERASATPAAPPAVREGVQAMRQELAVGAAL